MTTGDKILEFQKVWSEGSPASIASRLFNGLEPAAFYLRPELEFIKKRLMTEGALGVLLSGSGPTLFALAAHEMEAKKIASEFEGEGLEVVVTQTVSTGVQKV
jgi:4-diphosphocytidyl-2-C-methyl-D-erythritol kinase